MTDDDNHRIQKFDSSGNFLLKWGTPGPGEGQFSFPANVADYENNRLQKFQQK